jgi:hypothetical protein
MSRKTPLFVLCCFLLSLVVIAALSGPVFAQHNPPGKGNPHTHTAPELDPGTTTIGLALLVLGVLMVTDRSRSAAGLRRQPTRDNV